MIGQAAHSWHPACRIESTRPVTAAVVAGVLLDPSCGRLPCTAASHGPPHPTTAHVAPRGATARVGAAGLRLTGRRETTGGTLILFPCALVYEGVDDVVG
jgi:hypothetical protein